MASLIHKAVYAAPAIANVVADRLRQFILTGRRTVTRPIPLPARLKTEVSPELLEGLLAPSRPQALATDVFAYHGVVFGRDDKIPSIKMGICVLCPEGVLPGVPPTILPAVVDEWRAEGRLPPEDEHLTAMGRRLADVVKDALALKGYQMDDDLFPDLGWKFHGFDTHATILDWKHDIELPEVAGGITNLHTYWFQFIPRPANKDEPPPKIDLSAARKISIESTVAGVAHAFFAAFNRERQSPREAKRYLM